MKLKETRLIGIGLLIVFLTVIYFTPNTSAHRLSHREARKLVKLILAAALLAPPGFGVVPLPLPLPVPFAIESVKPPIIHPFPAHGHFGGGFGGYGGGIGGFG